MDYQCRLYKHPYYGLIEGYCTVETMYSIKLGFVTFNLN